MSETEKEQYKTESKAKKLLEKKLYKIRGNYFFLIFNSNL
jgi:hypothetical protein